MQELKTIQRDASLPCFRPSRSMVEGDKQDGEALLRELTTFDAVIDWLNSALENQVHRAFYESSW